MLSTSDIMATLWCVQYLLECYIMHYLFPLSLSLLPSLPYRLVLRHCPSVFAGVCLSLRSRLIRSADAAQEVCGAVIKPDRS